MAPINVRFVSAICNLPTLSVVYQLQTKVTQLDNVFEEEVFGDLVANRHLDFLPDLTVNIHNAVMVVLFQSDLAKPRIKYLRNLFVEKLMPFYI